MLKRLMMLMCAVAVCGVTLGAQQTKPAAKVSAKPAEVKAEPAARPAPEPPPLPVNIKIEVTITDQTGPGEPAKKVVSMIVGDRQRNSIRSSGHISVGSVSRNVTLNVDARPVIMPREGNRISLELGLEYLPRGASATELEPGTSSLNERLVVLLDSGKPVMVSQAADPASDRKITVEVTATILK